MPQHPPSFHLVDWKFSSNKQLGYSQKESLPTRVDIEPDSLGHANTEYRCSMLNLRPHTYVIEHKLRKKDEINWSFKKALLYLYRCIVFIHAVPSLR